MNGDLDVAVESDNSVPLLESIADVLTECAAPEVDASDVWVAPIADAPGEVIINSGGAWSASF